jgi:uncharacterized protein (DUF885 family)
MRSVGLGAQSATRDWAIYFWMAASVVASRRRCSAEKSTGVIDLPAPPERFAHGLRAMPDHCDALRTSGPLRESYTGGMTVTRRHLLALGVAGVGTAFLPRLGRAQICSPPQTLNQVADLLLRHLPEVGVYNGVPAALDGGPLARRMDEWSPAGLERYRSALDEAARLLEGAQCSGEGRAAMQLAVARAVIAAGTRTRTIRYGRPNPFWFSGHVPYVVTPVAGPHIDTPNVMMFQQNLKTNAALDAWLEKLEELGPGFDGVREKVTADEALGCRPPQVLLQKSLPVFDAFLTGDVAAHPLITSLRQRLNAAGVDARASAAAERRAVDALEHRVRPAYARLRDQIRTMVPRGQEHAGLWAQPDGEALYAANVRALGDSPLAPVEIHRVGLEQIRHITAEMDTLLRANGYTKGGVAQRYKALSRDERFRFADSDAGRSDALEFARQAIRGAEAKYPSILPADLRPRGRLEVRRTPPATEAGAPPAYCDPPSLDESTPSVFWLNLRDMKAVTRVSLPTTTYHEGVPGHFTAGSIARLQGNEPLLLSIASFNAYNEGWALYAERLMAELGAYAHDPFGDLGRLNGDLFRAIRLVVDTGLHQLRWTRERAIAFASDASGSAESEVVAEVERYMAWPAQALGYKLGQLRLLELRDGLRRRLGARFSLPAFHGAVLAQGSAPLDVVARRVDTLS